MNCETIRKQMKEERLVVLFRNVPVEKMGDISKALVRGGIKILEITFDQNQADPHKLFEKSVEAVRGAVGDALRIGAGTVLNAGQVCAACEMGAEFIVSPNTSQAVIEQTKKLGMMSVPGALTPTEIAAAWEYGADMVKLFPAVDMGLRYIWNIKGPLSHIPLMATGGVDLDTIPALLNGGIDCVGTGISIVDRELLKASDYEGMERLARLHVETVKKIVTV